LKRRNTFRIVLGLFFNEGISKIGSLDKQILRLVPNINPNIVFSSDIVTGVHVQNCEILGKAHGAALITWLAYKF
jgi:hypothetical protein